MLIGHVHGLLGRLARAVGLSPELATDGGRPDAPTGDAGGRATEPTDEPAFRTTQEQILDVVERNGGRVEQAAVVSTLDVSAATVSRRLGDLEDAGDVVRYKIGRKNVVCLSDQIDLPRAGNAPPDGASPERATS